MTDEQKAALIAAEAALRACVGPGRYLALEMMPSGGTVYLLNDVNQSDRACGSGKWSAESGRTIVDALYDAEENLAEETARFMEDYE